MLTTDTATRLRCVGPWLVAVGTDGVGGLDDAFLCFTGLAFVVFVAAIVRRRHQVSTLALHLLFALRVCVRGCQWLQGYRTWVSGHFLRHVGIRPRSTCTGRLFSFKWRCTTVFRVWLNRKVETRTNKLSWTWLHLYFSSVKVKLNILSVNEITSRCYT